jgi:hypothetical protein
MARQLNPGDEGIGKGRIQCVKYVAPVNLSRFARINDWYVCVAVANLKG